MRITVPQIIKKKKKGEKITMITSYDAPFSKFVDKSEIDMILVGDSLGMVVQGHNNTLSVTLDDIIYHTKIVVRNTTNPLIVADMPFMSYQLSSEDALRNAGRIIKETGAQAIKLEGGFDMLDTIKRITKASIPVMGHLGLLPQSINKLGGFKLQGKKSSKAQRMIDAAIALEEAGVFAIALEAIPSELAEKITQAISIPTIGIGTGNKTDGQVLVIYDMLGMDSEFNPSFLKKYLNLEELIVEALKNYKKDVEESKFPAEEHSYHKTYKKDLNIYSGE